MPSPLLVVTVAMGAVSVWPVLGVLVVRSVPGARVVLRVLPVPVVRR